MEAYTNPLTRRGGGGSETIADASDVVRSHEREGLDDDKLGEDRVQLVVDEVVHHRWDERVHLALDGPRDSTLKEVQDDRNDPTREPDVQATNVDTSRTGSDPRLTSVDTKGQVSGSTCVAETDGYRTRALGDVRPNLQNDINKIEWKIR